jgi:hypothetical protein
MIGGGAGTISFIACLIGQRKRHFTGNPVQRKKKITFQHNSCCGPTLRVRHLEHDLVPKIYEKISCKNIGVAAPGVIGSLGCCC